MSTRVVIIVAVAEGEVRGASIQGRVYLYVSTPPGALTPLYNPYRAFRPFCCFNNIQSKMHHLQSCRERGRGAAPPSETTLLQTKKTANDDPTEKLGGKSHQRKY